MAGQTNYSTVDAKGLALIAQDHIFVREAVRAVKAPVNI